MSAPRKPCNCYPWTKQKQSVASLQETKETTGGQFHAIRRIAKALRFLVKFTFGPTQITVNMPDRAALLAEISARFAAGQGFALATINLDHLVKLRRSLPFRAAYAAQDLVVADGNPVVWLSRLAGHPVSLLPGSDLVPPLCELALQNGLPVVFFGSTAEALDGAETALTTRFAGLRVVRKIAPPMGFDPAGGDAGLLLSQLAELGQEILAARGRALAPQVGFASVGAGLDFLSGHQTRAPAWVRALALEWLWRALSAPRRLIPRYAACAAILPAEVMAALRQRR